MASQRGQIDHRSFRHWGGFIFSGLTAFAIDISLTWVLVHGVGLDPFSARLIGILVATVVAWLMHRRITFNVAYDPSVMEFVRFFVVASAANGANYVTYAALLLIVRHIPLVVAIVLSSGVAGLLSYFGFRFGVFQRFEEKMEGEAS
jgi:putative flippase GtrA